MFTRVLHKNEHTLTVPREKEIELYKSAKLKERRYKGVTER